MFYIEFKNGTLSKSNSRFITKFSEKCRKDLITTVVLGSLIGLVFVIGKIFKSVLGDSESVSLSFQDFGVGIF